MTEAGRMLIVDDEAPVRDVLCDYFVERQFTVATAANGQEALAVFARERPDVVLLDVRMPGLDGLAVLKRLREADPRVAVIMVTANEDLAVARETLAIGAFDYVSKPFDFDHLDRTVVTAMIHSAKPPIVGTRPAPGASDAWSRLVADVFRAVRGMDAGAHASTGSRLEDAALAAARRALAGSPAEAAPHLAEITLLADVAARLGDLSPASRSVIAAALKVADAASTTWGA
ncbi:MAG TPA: response regulator [Candidatus Acidoferrum sp.]|nr:response regulator [Candidatus Acidoferrum sp.]